eukprot:6347353-Amphidinium_carterae.1
MQCGPYGCAHRQGYKLAQTAIPLVSICGTLNLGAPGNLARSEGKHTLALNAACSQRTLEMQPSC